MICLIKKHYLALVSFGLIVAVSGCVRNYKTAEVEEGEAGAEVTNGPYVIGIDDVIRIAVRADAEASGDFIVGPEGTFFHPLVGDVEAEGLTVPTLRVVLVVKFSKYIKEPRITVGVVAYRSKKVYVLGEVFNPGVVLMNADKLSLRDAVVKAGLPTPDAALSRTYVITPAKERPVVRKINLKQILHGGRMAKNIMLKPGDIVVVPSTASKSLGVFLAQILRPARQVRELDMIYWYFKEREFFLDPLYGRSTGDRF